MWNTFKVSYINKLNMWNMTVCFVVVYFVFWVCSQSGFCTRYFLKSTISLQLLGRYFSRRRRLTRFFERVNLLRHISQKTLSITAKTEYKELQILKWDKVFKKTVFKNLKGYGLLKVDYAPSNFLKAVFHKFYLFHPWIICPKCFSFLLGIWLP